MRLHCDNAAVLEDGRLRFFDEVEQAFEYHSHQMMN
jgi:ABC-type polysaccharide/polyol phosphate transport system ATPase subunit